MTTILVVAVALGLIPAFIAQGKGHSFVTWWFWGALLFIVALPAAIKLEPTTDAGSSMRKCPFCAEVVKREAVVCKHCHRDLPPAAITVDERRQ